jgi:hypothetical protein
MITAAAAGALFLAGCSGSSTDGKGSAASVSASPSGSPSAPTTSASTPSAPTSSPPTSASGGSGAAARIAGIPVQAGDLPSGWKVSPSDSSVSADDAAKQAALVKCVGATDTSAHRLARVEKDFSQGTNDIESNAQAMQSADDVEADVALLQSPKVSACYSRIIRKSLEDEAPSGATIDSLQYSIVSGSQGGPSNLVAVGHGVVKLSSGGQTVTLYADTFFIRGDRIEAEVDFSSLGARVDSALEQKVVTAVARRAADA